MLMLMFWILECELGIHKHKRKQKNFLASGIHKNKVQARSVRICQLNMNEQLGESLRNYPCLYDKKLPVFKDKNKKIFTRKFLVIIALCRSSCKNVSSHLSRFSLCLSLHKQSNFDFLIHHLWFLKGELRLCNSHPYAYAYVTPVHTYLSYPYVYACAYAYAKVWTSPKSSSLTGSVF